MRASSETLLKQTRRGFQSALVDLGYEPAVDVRVGDGEKPIEKPITELPRLRMGLMSLTTAFFA